jgi:transposase-like protein
MAKTTKPRLTLSKVEREFATDDDCKRLLKKLRWPDGKPVCPRCGEQKRVYKTAAEFRWKCKACNKNGYAFSVLTGTVFENTNVPLSIWFRVAFLMVSSKKGISALQVHRMIPPVRGATGSYKTAWYMCHRLRAAMQDGDFFRLMGEVEIDETYVGGSAKFAHCGNRGRQTSATPGPRGNLVPPKVGVVGAIARKGNVVCKVIGSAEAPTIRAFVRKTISSDVSLVATDESTAYETLAAQGYPHETVKHADREFVRGNVHTANLDSFWSLLKRGIVGTFHKVSSDHLPLYLNEFSWRYNNRDNPEIFHALLAGC